MCSKYMVSSMPSGNFLDDGIRGYVFIRFTTNKKLFGNINVTLKNMLVDAILFAQSNCHAQYQKESRALIKVILLIIRWHESSFFCKVCLTCCLICITIMLHADAAFSMVFFIFTSHF